MSSAASVKRSFDLTDKVAVITGGAGYLGEKHAEAVAEFGGRPILLDVDEQNGTVKSKKIESEYNVECKFIRCDITSEPELIRVSNDLRNLYGHIDILINNAAIDPKVDDDRGSSLLRLETFPLNRWNLELAAGLTGAMLCSKIWGYQMATRGKGVILNIASDLAIIAPDQRLYRKDGLPQGEQPVKPVTYSVIKHGLIGLTKYLATYWCDRGVRVNSLSPGGVYRDQESQFVERVAKLIPLGRMSEPNELKAAVVFLVSDASSYITGANLVVDGGRTCW